MNVSNRRCTRRCESRDVAFLWLILIADSMGSRWRDFGTARTILITIAKDGVISLRRAYSNVRCAICAERFSNVAGRIDVMWPEPYFVLMLQKRSEAAQASGIAK